MEVKAPFTDDQVASLNAFQQSGVFHPFTCGGKNCREDLVATPEGWRCPKHPKCSYTQNWAHAWMADWSWKPHFDWLQNLESGLERRIKEIEEEEA